MAAATAALFPACSHWTQGRAATGGGRPLAPPSLPSRVCSAFLLVPYPVRQSQSGSKAVASLCRRRRGPAPAPAPLRCAPLRARGRRQRFHTADDLPFYDLTSIPLAEPLQPEDAEVIEDAIDILALGGMGMIPTDTQHAYVTSLKSKKGTRRIYEAKGIASDERKPLSLLCADLSMASKYANTVMLGRQMYSIVSHSLPGPYTLILQATKMVPRVVLEHKSRRRSWQRREVGIRVPDCGIVQYITRALGEPLLCSTAELSPYEVLQHEPETVDFVIAGGDMDEQFDLAGGEHALSTIIDLTMEEPMLLRQGIGDSSLFPLLEEEETAVGR